MAIAAALGLIGRPAFAVQPEAHRLFVEGRVLLHEGRCDAAVVKFRESIAIEPTVGAYLNLGDCEERREHLADSQRAFEQAAALSGPADPIRTAEARRRAERLSPR